MKIGTFDLEGDGLLEDVTRVWCGVVKEHGGERRSFRPHQIQELMDYLCTFDVLIGHNCIAYDFAVLRKLYGFRYHGKVVDTLLMSRVQRPNRSRPPHCPATAGGPHSVAAWGYRLGRGKVEHEDWSQFSEEMLHRCEEDVEIQVKIYHALLEEGAGEGWMKAHKLNFKLFHYLQLQEEFGWPVDQDWMDHCCRSLQRWIDRIDRAVGPRLPLVCEKIEKKTKGQMSYVKKPFNKDGSKSAVCLRWLDRYPDDQREQRSSEVCGPFSRVKFRPVDLDKNEEVKAFLLSQGWVPEEWNTNDNGQRTSPKLSHKDSFIGITGGLGKLVAKRVQCKQRLGTINGWYKLIREDGRIASKNSGFATTGRIKHKGIVNVPGSDAFFGKWMRAVFTSRPGWVLVGCDSAGNQIRQLAARMHDEEFTNAVLHGDSKTGTDLHSLNQKRAGLPTRTAAKGFFYGFLFGAGDEKIGKLVGKGSKAGRQLKEAYLDGLPKLRKLIDNLTEEWRKSAIKWFNKKWNRMEYRDGYIKGIDGRPILVNSEHKVLVFTLQSDEAIQMAAAYVWFNKKMEERGYEWFKDFGCVIWYHDEYQVMCKDEIKQEVSELMEQSIKWAGEFFDIACPHEGQAKIGRNWRDTH